MTAHRVTDEGDARQYWTQLPNIVFEIGLKPLELTLYAHLKRAAGASGKCFKSTATLARETGMGAGTVSRTKTALEAKRPALGNKPLIRTRETPNPRGGKPFQEITITDIWKANTDRFSPSTVEIGNAESSSALEIEDVKAPSTVEIEPQNQVPETPDPSSKPTSKPISSVEIKKNSKKNSEEEDKKKVGAEAQTHPGVDLFRDVTGHFPAKEMFGLVESHLGKNPDDTLARECWREWLERGYNPRSLKWLTEWYAKGGPTGRSGQPTNGHKPQVELDPFGEPFVRRDFTAEDAIRLSPGKNPDDVRANFINPEAMPWEKVRCL